MATTIRTLTPPERGDDDSADGALFRAAAAHARRVGDERYAHGISWLSLEERLAAWQSSAAERHIRRLAMVDGRIVGASSLWLPLHESTEVADHGVSVE